MKAQNGFGSIVCLDKTGKKRRKPYAVRITSGWKGGKQQRKYLGYYKTQSEALMALAEYHKGGYDIDATTLTLGEVYDRWIKRIEPKSSKGVLDSHKMTENRLGDLRNKQFRSLKTDHWQDWIDTIDLKPGSKARMKNTISQLYEYAITNDMIGKNYAKSVEINEKVEKVGAVFTEAEIEKLWANRHVQVARWTLILIYTGMRIGELLKINRSTVYLEQSYMVGGSKTEAGKDRIIPIHDGIKELIEMEMSDHRNLVSYNGKSVDYQKAKRWFDEFMALMGWQHKPHDTRKTAVSLMHSSGIPMETVRIIVGHSGKGVTEQVYLRKTPTELVEAINRVIIPYL